MKKILVVDDEEGMRIALSEALCRAGYDTTCCVDGADAVTTLKASKFSMVITDVKMPKKDGMHVLNEVKKVSPETPVVMLTAYGTVDSAVEAMKRGACDYLLKPFSFDNLIEIVKSGLSQAADLLAGRPNAVGTHRDQGRSSREIMTSDPEMQRILELARNIGATNSTVLICGESGTGKELLAHYVHDNSPRKDRPFVAVNCAAIPDNLLESELFGHEKGSFTGAAFRKLGKFELAQAGTILLDEIGEMSMTLQAKLLRVLQEFEIDRVGGREPVAIDVRVVSTTNVDLKKLVQENKFREDLYYRLNVIPLRLPPLRERQGDIPLLAQHFLESHAGRCAKHIQGFAKEALALLESNGWKGNVRELQNTIERAVVLCRGSIIRRQDLIIDEDEYGQSGESACAATTIEEMERQLIVKTLNEKGGNRTHAAQALGISIRTLRNKLKEYRQNNIAFEGA